MIQAMIRRLIIFKLEISKFSIEKAADFFAKISGQNDTLYREVKGIKLRKMIGKD